MTLQEQLRKLTTGGPGVTHIATETLFEDCAQKLDDDWKDHQALMALLAAEKYKSEHLTALLRSAHNELTNAGHQELSECECSIASALNRQVELK